MPELPEVETYRRYLESSSMNQKIVDFTSEDPLKLLLNDVDEMHETLLGRQFIETKRVGKHLFVRLDRGDFWLYMHFGMSGDLAYFHPDSEPPKHARIVFFFENGFRLGFICPRKFERVGLTNDPDLFLQKKKIGLDVLEITPKMLFLNLQNRKMAIKSTLLDQSVAAGVGNWIADDVLHRAKILPIRLANSLDFSEVESLHAAIQKVVQSAISVEANYAQLSDDFLIHARGWGRANATSNCPNCGSEITQIRVGGRATYFCEKCQI
jgi:formamidopyrimidine-DNA glycosylase